MTPRFRKDFFIICLIVTIGTGFFIFHTLDNQRQSQISSVLQTKEVTILPDGTLLKSQNDERVYYIEESKKRWIESREAFRLQGFRPEDIKILSPNEASYYKEGKPITGQSNIILPYETGALPDLVPLPIKNLQLKKLNGRTILKFTASFLNQGEKHFELAVNAKTEFKSGETYQEVYQSIAGENGIYRNKVVGNFSWHIPHKHYHYSDFADYVFSFVKPASDTQVPNAPKTIRQKTTFCIRDNEPFSPTVNGAPQKAIFPTCGQDRQGLSIGWVDIYKNTLPDQYIDINDMPAGTYSLSFFLDPNQRFIEEHKDNNISTIFIELDVKKNLVKIIASATPFTTALNNFPNKTTIRAGGENKIYIIHNNKKRLLNNLSVFNSYDYLWDNIFVLTKSMIDSIPTNNLVRLQDTKEVYALNNFGYKRHILNPGVFDSYDFLTSDIAEINQTEFVSYPESNMIRRTGDDEIYLIDGLNKKKIGTIDTAQNLGYNLNAIHTVNESDFNSYATTIFNEN